VLDRGLSASGRCGIPMGEPSHGPLGEIQMARRRGQLKGYVHQQGSVWYLAYREDALDKGGKIIRIRRNRRIPNLEEGATKRDAQREAREVLDEVDKQAQRPSSLETVEEFIKGRFEPDQIWAMKHAGKLHYQNMFKHVLPAIGHMRLRDVTSVHVRKLVKMKIEAGFSVQTALHIRNVISAVFKHAKLENAYRGDNPVIGVRLPEMQRRETRSLSFDQGNKVITAIPSPAREMALLSMTTSLNVAEMLALRWKWVNLSGEVVVVGGELLEPFTLGVRENYYRGKFGSVKAKSRRRNVPLSKLAVDALRGIQGRSRFTADDDLVFCSGKGTPLNENNLMRRQIKPAAKVLGMPWLSWHVFRHSHATFGEAVGMALSDRQAQMGHGDVRMTMHYTHSDMQRRRVGIERMSTRLMGEIEVSSVN
jgi:Site-specific recombinase XerD